MAIKHLHYQSTSTFRNKENEASTIYTSIVQKHGGMVREWLKLFPRTGPQSESLLSPIEVTDCAMSLSLSCLLSTDAPFRRSVSRGPWCVLGSAWGRARSSAPPWPWPPPRSASLQTSRSALSRCCLQGLFWRNEPPAQGGLPELMSMRTP